MKYSVILLCILCTACGKFSKKSSLQPREPSVKVNLTRYGKDYNYCKELKEEVLLYFVFVDSDTEAKWNSFSVENKQKQIDSTVHWLENEGRKNDVLLNIKTDYFSVNDSIVSIQNKMKYGSIKKALEWSEKGVDGLNRWAQNVSDMAYRSLINKGEIDQSLTGVDRLVTYIQNRYKASNTGLIFLKNAPVKEDISMVFNSFRDSREYKKRPDGEFAIITDNHRPAVIAHEVLHLFGAEDFYSIGYNVKYYTKKEMKRYRLKSSYAYYPASYSNKTYLLREYPNAIMRNITYDVLDSLTVSPVTQYLIGWKSKYDLTTRDKEFLLYGDYIDID